MVCWNTSDCKTAKILFLETRTNIRYSSEFCISICSGKVYKPDVLFMRSVTSQLGLYCLFIELSSKNEIGLKKYYGCPKIRKWTHLSDKNGKAY